MQNIETQCRRLNDAEQRVHICAVAINQTARLMDNLQRFNDVFVKQPQRVRVGDHNPSQLLIALFTQIVQIDVAAFSCAHRLAFKAAHNG